MIFGGNQLLKRRKLSPQLPERLIFRNADGARTFACWLLGFCWGLFRLDFCNLPLPLSFLFFFAGFTLLFLSSFFLFRAALLITCGR